MPHRSKRSQNFWKNETSKIHKNFSTLYWIFEILQILITQIAGTTHSLLPILKTTGAKDKITITPDKMKDFTKLYEALDQCCQLPLRQALPGKQLVLKTDAKLQAAGYAVLGEDDPN